MAPVAVIDLADKASENRDYLATAEDVEAWEAKFGEIPEKSIVSLCCMNTHTNMVVYVTK